MKVLGIIAVVILGTVAAYFIAYPTYTHRYRLTVDVEVDGQIKSGSSVIEARWITVPPWFPMGIAKAFETRIYGEAVYVDLGARGPLIVTLFGDDAPGRRETSKNASSLALEAFGLKAEHAGLAAITSRKGPTNVPPQILPRLITFADVSNPKSTRAFEPSEIAQVFGPNIRLRSATIELTSAPITRSIREKLPWLREMDPSVIVGHLQGGRNPDFYAMSLTGE